VKGGTMFGSIYKALSAIGYTHPIHPAMTHLPLGMAMGALIFALAGLASRRSGMEVTARQCTILALISVFPTMVLGYMDWHQYYGGAWLFPIKMKIVLAISLILLLGFSIYSRRESGTGFKTALVVYTLCFLNAAGLGYFGGELVFGKTAAAVQKDHSSGPTRATYADVGRIFNQSCVVCHSGSSPPAGVRLDTYANIMAGGQAGAMLIPGKPDESELVLRIKGIEQPRMPFGKPPLESSEISVIVRWVEEGAPGNSKTDAGN
jgi:uncharacterized membrane protein